MPNKITTLYSDSAKTNALYPRTYTTAVHDSNNNLQENVNQYLAGNFAQIETSPATSAHSVGDYIIYNYQLYKAISAIAVSDSLVVNTNIISANILDQLTINPGTTITFSSAAEYVGILSSSSKLIVFDVSFNKPIEAENVSISALYLSVRKATGGNIINAVDVIADQSLTVTYVINGSSNTVHVAITSTTAYSETNNTPLVVEVRTNSSFTFS